MSKESTKEISFKEEIMRNSSNALSDIDFIQNKQQEAAKLLSELNFPNKRQEEWKYFDTKDILEFGNLKPSQEQNVSIKDVNELIKKHIFPETTDRLIVTLNGDYNEELSNFKNVGKGLKILNFNKEKNLDKDCQALVSKYFATEGEDRFFKLTNTALMNNGFFLHAEKNHLEEKPIQILHISNSNSFNQLRSLIYLAENSNINLIVTYVGVQGTSYLTNAVIETIVKDGAKLSLNKIQDCSKKSTHLYDLSVKLNKDSELKFSSFNFGAGSTREDINVEIDGSGAHADVNGLYVLNGDRKSHHKVIVDHKAPNATSNQLFKGLLEDNSKAEFNGLIEVRKEAQKTDAQQLNNNILLSDEAHVDSRPQLNIVADDVKCAHGSTTGRASDDALFYLQSRGLDEATAKTILTYSFCQEVIEKISLDSAQNYASALAYESISSSHKSRTKEENKAINILAGRQ